MNFDQLSDADLAALVAQGAAELSRRLLEKKLPGGETGARDKEIAGPSSAEVQHIRDCLRIFRKNGFVHADDVHEYRRIAKKFPSFMKLHRYPDDCRGSSITRWLEKQGE